MRPKLDLANVNLSRAVGPAVARLVTAKPGDAPVVFALNALSVVFLVLAVLVWRRPQTEDESPRERFVPARRAGGRYVIDERVLRRLLRRAFLFVANATAL